MKMKFLLGHGEHLLKMDPILKLFFFYRWLKLFFFLILISYSRIYFNHYLLGICSRNGCCSTICTTTKCYCSTNICCYWWFQSNLVEKKIDFICIVEWFREAGQVHWLKYKWLYLIDRYLAWLTAAVDHKRVIITMPLVMNMLNFQKVSLYVFYLLNRNLILKIFRSWLVVCICFIL